MINKDNIFRVSHERKTNVTQAYSNPVHYIASFGVITSSFQVRFDGAHFTSPSLSAKTS